MKRRGGEAGFTLLEMAVVLAVVALIGSLLVGAVVAANSNRADARVIEFFDQEIEKANENFKIEPQKVITAAADRPEPFKNMNHAALGANRQGFQYTGLYNEDLAAIQTGTTGTAKYQMLVEFEQEAGTSGEITGFTRHLVSYKMTAMVLEKTDNGYDRDNPLHVRTYKGISVDTENIDLGREGDYTVTFHIKEADKDAKIINPSTGAQATNELKVGYQAQDHFYSQSVTAVKDGDVFAGWSLDENSKELIPSGTKVEGNMDVWAVFTDYRLEFRLAEGQQFDSGIISAPGNKENYFVERKFSDVPGDGVKIGEIATKDRDKKIVEKLMGEPAGQVNEMGYEFMGWQDALTKEPVSESLGGEGLGTLISKDKPYMQLEAKMKKIEADEKIRLELSLNLEDYLITNEKMIRKFFMYDITDMEFSLRYDKSGGQMYLDLTEYQTWDNKREEVSKDSFRVGDGDGMLTVNGSRSSIDEYLKSVMKENKGKYVVVEGVSLTVKAPAFNSSRYRGTSGNETKDPVYKAGTDVKLSDDKLLESLDLSSTDMSQKLVFRTKDGEEISGLPMDRKSVDDLNERLLDLYSADTDQGQIQVMNAGTVSYSNTGGDSVRTQESSVTVKEKPKVQYGSREISLRVIIPMSLVYTASSEGGINIKVSTFVENNSIKLKVRSYWAWGGWSLFSNDWGDGYQIDTGIPYKEQYQGATIYNHINNILVGTDTGDSWITPYHYDTDIDIRDGAGPKGGKWFDESDSLGKMINANYGGSRQKSRFDWQGWMTGTTSMKQWCDATGNKAGYCQFWYPQPGSDQRITNGGFYEIVGIRVNDRDPNSHYLLQTSLAKDTPRIKGGLGYSGDNWYWSEERKSNLRSDFVNKWDGDKEEAGRKFDEYWDEAKNERVSIINVIEGGTSTVKTTRYSFNFENDGLKYTSLPKYLECRSS